MLAFLTVTAPGSPRTHQEAGVTGLPPDQAADARALRATLRRGLTAAIKARDTEALAALRTAIAAIAAIDNAEAVEVPDDRAPARTRPESRWSPVAPPGTWLTWLPAPQLA
jgi:hypothetical protein